MKPSFSAGKYTTSSGITFIGEFYTPPNIPYYRDMAISPLAGRQRYLFLDAARTGSRAAGLEGMGSRRLHGRQPQRPQYTAIFDATRRFGNRFSTYLHLEIPTGKKLRSTASLPTPQPPRRESDSSYDLRDRSTDAIPFHERQTVSPLCRAPLPAAVDCARHCPVLPGALPLHRPCKAFAERCLSRPLHSSTPR